MESKIKKGADACNTAGMGDLADEISVKIKPGRIRKWRPSHTFLADVAPHLSPPFSLFLFGMNAVLSVILTTIMRSPSLKSSRSFSNFAVRRGGRAKKEGGERETEKKTELGEIQTSFCHSNQMEFGLGEARKSTLASNRPAVIRLLPKRRDQAGHQQGTDTKAVIFALE